MRMLRRILLSSFAAALLAQPASAQHAGEAPAAAPWSVRMAESVIRRNPILLEKWDYISGVVLSGFEQLWKRTGDPRYLEYIQRNTDEFVQPDGSIRTYELEEFNIDEVNQGKVLFTLYRETGDERYRKAAELLREQMRRHPRTSEGGFWHKQIYPHQMWLDGLYMASPFLARYAAEFDEPALFDDVAKQILLIARHTRDPETGLFHHGWDESRSQIWADPETGLSPNFWGRAVGWYAMGIVDVLDHLPADHPDRAAVIRVFQGLAEAVAKVQDPVTGLWYQVLDQPNREGNYHEASASSMFAYALAKGANRGYLGPEYRRIADRAYDGILEHMVTVDEQGLVSLNRIVSVAGLGGKQQRDGSFEYYISEPVVSNDYKGVGAFLKASVELGR